MEIIRNANFIIPKKVLLELSHTNLFTDSLWLPLPYDSIE